MTDTTTAPTSVTISMEVAAPVERAFHVFTAEMASWWNPEHHLIAAPLQEMVVEPRVGGAIYDLGTDGSRCQWARVLAYEPPTRFVFSWDINLQWQVETDPARCSEVEVTFAPSGDSRTSVTLEHKHLDRHGDGWQAMGAAVGSANGWPDLATRFTAAVA